MRIYCLPYAGGSARRFRRLFRTDPPGATIVPVEYAGRGRRTREATYPGFPEAMADLAREIRTDEPFALLGHSLGALLAAELAYRFSAACTPPAALIVSGRNAVHLPAGGADLRRSDLTDAQLLANLSRAGARLPATCGPLTTDGFLPVLRADLRLAHSYRFEPGRSPLPCPITALYGSDDPYTTATAVGQWQRHTRGRCTVHQIQGGHFFLFDRPEVTRRLIAEVAAAEQAA